MNISMYIHKNKFQVKYVNEATVGCISAPESIMKVIKTDLQLILSYIVNKIMNKNIILTYEEYHCKQDMLSREL